MYKSYKLLIYNFYCYVYLILYSCSKYHLKITKLTTAPESTRIYELEGKQEWSTIQTTTT